MAEQYASFQGREPNIDINLYPNAMNQGIAAGNAQKSVVSSVIQGAVQGAQTGIGIVQGIQQIQSNANALAVSSDPQVQQAEKDTRIAAGAQAALKTEILTQNKTLAVEAEVAALTRQKEENNLKLSDINGEKAIGSALNTIGSLASPDEQRDLANQILMSNNGLFSRNTQLAYQTMQQMKPYASPEVYKQTFDGVSAFEQQKLMQARLADEEKRKAVYAEKTQEKFTDATVSVRAGLGNIPVEEINPEAVRLYDEATVSRQPDGTVLSDPVTKMPVTHAALPGTEGKSYVLTHYNKIGSTYDDKRYVDMSKQVDTFTVGASSRPEWSRNTRPQAQPGNPADINTTRAGLAASLPVPGTPSTGTTPADKASARYQALGPNPTFESLRQQSAARVRNSAVTKANDITLPTDTPIPANVKPTVSPTPVQIDPAVTGKNFSSLEFNQNHLKNVLGGADVTINIPFGNPTLSKKTFDAVNSIDAAKNQSALAKAVILTESGGNVNAVNRDAVGAMQMRPGAAQDTGLALEDRTNPDKAIPAGIEYINQIAAQVERGMNAAEKLLATELANKLPIKPDLRMTISAYNGGGQDVLRAIRSGAKTWDQVDDYLRLNKSPAAYKENTDYVNRVISASIPFLTGGNASDNAYVNALKDANIITITPPDER